MRLSRVLLAIVLLVLACAGYLLWAVMNSNSYDTLLGKIELEKGLATTKTFQWLVAKNAFGTKYFLATSYNPSKSGSATPSPDLHVKVAWRNTGSTPCRIGPGPGESGWQELPPNEKRVVFDGELSALIKASGSYDLLRLQAEPSTAELSMEFSPDKPLESDLHLELWVYHFRASL